VSEHNVASTSFDVAYEEGGSSPLSVDYGKNGQPETSEAAAKVFERKQSSESQHNIEAAEEVMRLAALAASRISEGDSTPATPLLSNDKSEGLESQKETESMKETTIDDFDRQVEMRDTSGDKDLDSNIYSA